MENICKQYATDLKKALLKECSTTGYQGFAG
jgi:hypothetical protein